MIASSSNYFLNLADLAMGGGFVLFLIGGLVCIAAGFDDDDGVLALIGLGFLIASLLCLAGVVTLVAA